MPVKSAFILAGGGRHYLIVSPETVRSAALELSQLVEVRFRVSDQEAVDRCLQGAYAEFPPAKDEPARERRAWPEIRIPSPVPAGAPG